MFKHKMIELKARVNDYDNLKEKLIQLGAEFDDAFEQTDTYFKVPKGRLKLRKVKDDTKLQLIYYERENIAGPKCDKAFLLQVEDSQDFINILNRVLTPLVVIKKFREIYHYQKIQIHMDTVKGLGTFIEFERQTADDSNELAEKQVLEQLMKKLEINPKNLEPNSYSDLFKK
jgi:adenylate cyclase, class 2